MEIKSLMRRRNQVERQEPFEVNTGNRMAEKLGNFGVHDDQLQALSGQPMSPTDLLRTRKGLGRGGPIRGYVQLNTGGSDNLQHLPYDSRGGDAGIIARFTIGEQTEASGIGTRKTLLAYETDNAPGYIWQQIAAHRAAEVGAYDPLAGVTGFFLIFRKRMDILHPLADKDPERFSEAGSFVLSQVLTTADACPRTGGVNFAYEKKDKDTGEMIPKVMDGPIDTVFPGEDLGLREGYTPKAYANLILETILVAGRHFNPADKYDYREDKDMNVDTSDFIDGVLAVLQDDVNGTVSLLRAYYETMAIEMHIQSRGGEKGLTLNDKRLIKGRQAKILEEAVQSISTSDSTRQLDALAQMDVGTQTNPMRYKMEVVDHMTIRALEALSHYDGYKQQAELQLQIYQALKIPASGGLVIEETVGNPLATTNPYLEHVKVYPDGRQAYAYSGQQIPVSAPYGAFPVEVNVGMVDSEQPNMMKGNVGEFKFKGGYTINDAGEEILVIDAMRAPAKLMKYALALGALVTPHANAGGQYMDQNPTLERMLNQQCENPEIELVELSEKGIEPKATLRHHENGDRSAIQLVRGRDKITRPRIGNIRERKVAGKQPRVKYEVVLDQPLKPGEEAFDGIAVWPAGPEGNIHVSEVAHSPFMVEVAQSDTRRLEALRESYNNHSRTSRPAKFGPNRRWRGKR